MNTQNVTENNKIKLPKCLTTNYYFFHPASYSYKRRDNEERIIGEAEDFFKKVGFNVTESEHSGFTATTTFMEENVKVIFDYRESCRNIYKTFKVFKNGKKSNVRTIKGIVDRM